jgi:CTD small phosphatase-like protein 2
MAQVRLAWDPKQMSLCPEWLLSASGASQPLHPHEQNPRTPQKPLVETPQKMPEAPKGLDWSDEKAPPKGLNSNQASRRDPRLVHTQHINLRNKVPSWKDSNSGKPSAKRHDMNALSHQVDVENRPPTVGDGASTPAACRRHKGHGGSRRGSDPSPRLQLAEPKAEATTLVSGPPVAGASIGSIAAATRELLPEFAVTSQRYSRESAMRSFEELPTSLRHALMFIRNVPALPCTKLLDHHRPMLPPCRPDLPQRPTLVLDLDETLVHCSRSSSSRSNPFPVSPDLIVTFDDQPSTGTVGFRPFVKPFLEATSKVFELVVFTASQQSYADKVIQALDPTGTMIEHRLYRQHCTELRGAFFKELGLLGRPLNQCILVDNSPISVACNEDNSVLIRSWYGDPNDQELYDLLGVFQDMLMHGGDCGQYLANRYGLRDYFEALRDSAGHHRP